MPKTTNIVHFNTAYVQSQQKYGTNHMKYNHFFRKFAT